MSTAQIPTINMKVRRFATQFQYSMIALVLMNVCPSRALAQDEPLAHMTQQNQEHDAGPAEQASALIKIVRESTERFKDVQVAEGEGYRLQFGCVSGDDFGAMGLHYVNGALVGSGVVDATRPQIVIYEPTARRKPETDRRRLSGYRRRVECEASGRPPELMGQLFHYVREPQSLRAPGVLHAACLGVEGQSQGRVRKLAPQRFVRVVRRPNHPSQAIVGPTAALQSAGGAKRLHRNRRLTIRKETIK